MRVVALSLLFLLASPPAVAHAGTTPPPAPGTPGAVPGPGTFQPSPELDLGTLERLVRTRSPGVQEAALEADLAAAEVTKSKLLPNPTLDAGWGTIPIGQTNPANLPSPLTQIPNYSIGLSYTFPIGKRGPRLDRAVALEQSARASLDADVRYRALDLARLLGSLAATTMRLHGLRQIADDSRQQVQLAETRVNANMAAPLELDRLKVEASRIEQQVRSAESDVSAALAACSALVGSSCAPFASGDEARKFLIHWIDRAVPAGSVEERPDVRALDAAKRAADAELRWARAQAIPDPTVRVGYLRDQFVISGNQLNSFNVSVSLPLPVFDRGQAEIAAAEARKERLSIQRDKVVQVSQSRVPELVQRLEAQRQRQKSLTEEILPRAQGTLRDLERAAENRLVPMTDVIGARRAVSELLVEEADSFGDAFDASLQITAELFKKNEEKR
jgi:cobalt-zinc-cadmium efflux system outer membrane protein